MTKHVPFHIKSGIPFGKTILVTLPTGRDWWTAQGEFEVLSQIREAPDYSSSLILDIAQFMTVTFDPGVDADLVTIDLDMTGADTRLVTGSGYYDVVMSDIYAIDDRAFPILQGAVYRTALVTSDTEHVT